MDLGWSYARFSGVAIVTLFTMTHVHIVASLLCLYELDKLLVHQTMHIVAKHFLCHNILKYLCKCFVFSSNIPSTICSSHQQ